MDWKKIFTPNKFKIILFLIFGLIPLISAVSYFLSPCYCHECISPYFFCRLFGSITILLWVVFYYPMVPHSLYWSSLPSSLKIILEIAYLYLLTLIIEQIYLKFIKPKNQPKKWCSFSNAQNARIRWNTRH